MRRIQHLLILGLCASLFFTTSCSEETMLAEQCETETSCESNPESKTDWVSTGGIGAGALALGALAGSAGGGGDSGNSSSSDTSSSSSTTGTTGDTITTETDTSTTDTSTTTPSDTSTTETDTSVTLKATTEFCEDVCDGLVAYYPFFGNANDTSGNGHDLSVVSATLSEDRDGNANRSYYFDGENDFIFSENLDLELSNYSVSLIIKLEKTSPYFEDFSSVGSEWDSWSISTPIKIYGENHRFRVRYQNYYDGVNYSLATVAKADDGNDEDDTRTANNNPYEYSHIVFVLNYDSKLFYIYIDGELMGASSIVNSTSPYFNSIKLGMAGSLSDLPMNRYAFNGWIDELRIYNLALSESEIQQMIGQ